MDNTNLSPLLRKLVTYAETFDGQPPAALTAERFMYAALCATEPEITSGSDEETAELEKLNTLLSDFFRAESGSGRLDAVRHMLLAKIETDDRRTQCVSYMRTRLSRAEKAAADAGCSDVSSDMLLDAVLRRPDVFIGEVRIAAAAPEAREFYERSKQQADVRLQKAFGKETGK